MKCGTCNKNRSEKKMVVVSFMRKEKIMCDDCFKTSDMKLIRRYTTDKE